MKIERIWKIIIAYAVIGTLILALVNTNWHSRNPAAYLGWELISNTIYLVSIFGPVALGIIIGRKMKTTLAAWVVGITVFIGTGFIGIKLIDEAPRQIKWRIEAMRDSSANYDDSRR